MSRLTIFLAKLIGLFALLLALVMAVHKQAIIDTANALVHERAVLFVFAMAALACGLAIVIGHNVWSGGLLPLVVTVLGWLLVLRGLLLLLLPPESVGALLEAMRLAQLFYVYVAITFLIGLYLTGAGFLAGHSGTSTEAR